MKEIKIALAGNPNSGKTTIFNMLTGTRQKVGNYPGVTVEKKQGVCRYNDYEMEIVDLPGTYCLSAYSEEELVARHYILDRHPDVVVDIIDASNVERNLYLATQLIEMGVPLVLVFNMSDVAERKGLKFDIEQLERLLGAKIVEAVGNKNRGREDILEAIVAVAEKRDAGEIKINFGSEIEEELGKIERVVEDNAKGKELAEKYGRRWLALKLLEQDCEFYGMFSSEVLKSTVDKSVEHIKHIFKDGPEIIIADRRYGFISGACQETVINTIEHRHDRSDKIDAVLTHKVFGLPIFVVLMYVVFQMVFLFGKWPMMFLEWGFGLLGDGIIAVWPGGEGGPLLSLIVDGIIGGVGGVIVFLPNILILFLAIAVLEDTGYMARAAFIMDRIMHKIGLHGKSFIPMLIGFGCSVPAIMATRILENRRNRITTIMVTPLMSCGARFPIYALLIPAFFADRWRGPVLWMIYFLGIIIAIVCAKLLRSTLLKGETVPFVMELPPYRIPTVKGVLIHMWERGWLYLKKAGTIILLLSVLLWAATSFPKVDVDNLKGMSDEQAQSYQLKNSVVGRIGAGIEPAIKPLGFDWKIGTALVGALGAKEVFVSQLGIVYSLGEADDGSEALRLKLKGQYSSLQGFCVMLFCLISAPCIATFAITKRETNSWGWAFLQWFGLTGLAYVVTLVVYQIGSVFV